MRRATARPRECKRRARKHRECMHKVQVQRGMRSKQTHQKTQEHAHTLGPFVLCVCGGHMIRNQGVNVTEQNIGGSPAF